ncbi:MAG: NAD(P)-dependent oxidoreductase [Bacteroidota bacterium]|nr:NAD(P)-dependent oxidoreductase [Bacteroidota bacterium]
MKKITIGILKETKNPPDKRVALTPSTALELQKRFPEIEIKIQSSYIRSFKDEEYRYVGLNVVDDVSDCDILIGIKEVDIPSLIPNKPYLFFSHVAKKQNYNKPLLQAILKENVTLIDYEYLTNKKGMRLIAFGKWAGIVGAYNAIRTWCFKYDKTELKAAYSYLNKLEMFDEISDFTIDPIKIALTGGGRVAQGAIETLNAFGIKEVSTEDFLLKDFSEVVYTKIEPWDYVERKDGKEFDLNHFFKNPTEYISTFKRFTKVADIYIPCHFWDHKSPKFFTREDAKEADFNIKVIGDVSCDIDGPIASTLRASKIEDPFYDYNPQTEKEEDAFSNENNISVMAVDNLPGELPRDASEDFSLTLIENIIPHLLGNDSDEVIKRATITKEGKLTETYSYLNDWVKS